MHSKTHQLVLLLFAIISILWHLLSQHIKIDAFIYNAFDYSTMFILVVTIIYFIWRITKIEEQSKTDVRTELERDFYNLLKLAKIGTWEYNFKTNTLEISSKGKKILELPDELTDTKQLIDKVKIVDKESAISFLKNSIKGQKTEVDYYVILESESKRNRYIHSRAEIKYNAKGKPLYAKGTINDFTAQKRINDNLQRLQIAVHQGANSVIITNKDGIIEYANPKFEQVSGYKFSEVRGLTPGVLKSGIHSKEFYNELWQTLKSGNTWRGEFCNKNKSGQLYWEIASIVPIYDEYKHIVSYVAIKEDITSLKRAETQLMKNREQLKHAQKIAKLGNWELDYPTGNVLWSDEVFHIYEIDFSQPNLEVIAKYHDKSQHDKAISMLQIAAQNHVRSFEFPMTIKTASGKTKYTTSHAELYYDEANNLSKVFGTVQDITTQKLVEMELEKARYKAEESDRLKTSFIANLSHELRTPMNGIIGFAEILNDPNLDADKRAHYIKIIVKNGHQLLSIVNDILDISKIETGQLEIKPSLVDINSLITEICYSHTTEAKQLQNTINQVSIVEKYKYIEADEIKLKQILNNLVSNAIKFTNKGTITIGASKLNDTIEFYVKDTGIGINEKNQEIIFDQFKQVEQGYARRYGGTGLGLSICKGLLHAMNGAIWVESEIGKGATFFFNIPYVEAIVEKETTTKKTKYPELQDKLLLLVEDEEVNMTYLKVMAKSIGVNYITAYDGLTAVTKCQEHSEIDLVLMDIKLPGIDGKEASRRIKAIRPDLPIIAQTAFAMLNDRDSILNAGCDDYISKPIIKAKLIELIQKYIHKKSPTK